MANQLLASGRTVGDPGRVACPYPSSGPRDWPIDVETLARRMRLHHYQRVQSAPECISLLPRTGEVRLALEITRNWYDSAEWAHSGN